MIHPFIHPLFWMESTQKEKKTEKATQPPDFKSPFENPKTWSTCSHCGKEVSLQESILTLKKPDHRHPGRVRKHDVAVGCPECGVPVLFKVSNDNLVRLFPCDPVRT